MVEKECLMCGKKFEARTNRAKYCSGSCKERYRVANAPHNATCSVCGNTFYNKNGAKKYCSAKCGNEANRGKAPMKILTCIDCGIEFKFRGRTKKLRCTKCWNANRSKETMKYRAAKDPRVRVGIGSGGGQHWDPTRAHRNNRDDIKDIMKYLRQSLAKKFNYTCQLCGVQKKNNKGLQVHHISMDSLDNSMNNVALLCTDCHEEVHRIIKYDSYNSMKPITKELCISVFNVLKNNKSIINNEEDGELFVADLF